MMEFSMAESTMLLCVQSDKMPLRMRDDNF